MSYWCDTHGGHSDTNCLFCDYESLELSRCTFCLVEINWLDGGSAIKNIEVKRKCERHS